MNIKLKLSTSLGRQAFTPERVASLQKLLKNYDDIEVVVILDHMRFYRCSIDVRKGGRSYVSAIGDDYGTADMAAFKAIVSLGNSLPS